LIFLYLQFVPEKTVGNEVERPTTRLPDLPGSWWRPILALGG
jgi:hypothetical protein